MKFRLRMRGAFLRDWFLGGSEKNASLPLRGAVTRNEQNWCPLVTMKCDGTSGKWQTCECNLVIMYKGTMIPWLIWGFTGACSIWGCVMITCILLQFSPLIFPLSCFRVYTDLVSNKWSLFAWSSPFKFTLMCWFSFSLICCIQYYVWCGLNYVGGKWLH